MTTTSTTTLARLAVEHAAASRVFHRHGLDFCCQGARTLAEACGASGLDGEEVLAEILEQSTSAPPSPRWDERPLQDVIAHVVDTYHARLREEMPRLLAMARKVEEVHAGREGVPAGLAAHLERFFAELEEHLSCEEDVIFPALAAGRGPEAAVPLRVLGEEHDAAAADLRKSRTLATDFVAPEGACATWQALYLGLAELELELMEHVHLENHVLFPRALAGR